MRSTNQKIIDLIGIYPDAFGLFEFRLPPPVPPAQRGTPDHLREMNPRCCDQLQQRLTQVERRFAPVIRVEDEVSKITQQKNAIEQQGPTNQSQPRVRDFQYWLVW